MRLQANSPAIDAGLQSNLPADTQDLDGDDDTTEQTPLDLDNNPRVVGNEVDMGAFEFSVDPTPTNQPPVANDDTFSIAENSAVNTPVGTVSANDPDGDNLTYSITAGNPNLDGDATSAFTIDSNSGAITVADSDDIDFETNPNNTLTVTVTDDGTPALSDTATITINLTDVEPEPETNQSPVANDDTFFIAENSAVSTPVGTVSANDPDGDNLTYSITAGNPNLDGDATSAFTIDSNSGAITVADRDDIDFETNPNNTLTVTVTDDGTPTLSDTATITINLTDVEPEPETNDPPVANDDTFDLAENSSNGTVVGTVSASDPDGDNLTYSITAGNPNLDGDATSAFTIDSNSGAITVADSDDIDFETNPNNQLTVTVTDDGTPALSDTATITINLTDIEPEGNNPPIVNNNQTFTLPADSPIGTEVGIVSASDPDGDTLSFSITNNNNDTDGDGDFPFAIDDNGLITVTDPDDINFGDDNTINLSITASDGQLQDTASIAIFQVNDVSLEIKLYEDNGGTPGDEITAGNAILGNSFFVEVLLGDIRPNAVGLVTSALDLGFAPDVAQNIDNPFDPTDVSSPLVTPNFPLFRGGTLDNPNGLIDNLSGGSLPQGGQGSAIGVNELERFGLIHFEVLGTRDDSQIVIDLDAAQTGFADGTLIDPNCILQFSRNLIINDAPEVDPIADTSLPENSPTGTTVVAAEDVTAMDDGFGDPVTFSLSTIPTDGDGNPLFTIDPNTGEITLTAAGSSTIDFESGITDYTLGVTASDGFKSSVEETFTVNILNENEATIEVDKTAITFGTPLSQFRDGATDSDLVRPNFPDTFQFIDITNNAEGDEDILSLSGIDINVPGVSINADFSNGDLLLNPGETQRILLTYAPSAAGEDFNPGDGLTILSNATNDSDLAIALTGKSTFNSDISYDANVNLADLIPLQQPGLFNSSLGDANYEPTADITGDGTINLAELVTLNAELGSSLAA